MTKLKTCLLASACMIFAGHAHAADAPKDTGSFLQNVKISGSLKGQYLGDDNFDLGTASENYQNSESLEGKMRITAPLTDTTTVFGEVRGLKNYGDGGSIDLETGEASGTDDFLELRQLWVQEDQLFGNLPWSIRVGRQRFTEPYALWWNRDFDAVRVIYDTTLFSGYLAVGENLLSYRTSGDDFLKRNEDVFRVLGETSWQYTYNHFFETRFSMQDDHSGMENPGETVSTDNRDSEDGDLYWAGVRFKGAVPSVLPQANAMQYRVDLMGVTGQSKTQQTIAGPGSRRTVTGSEEKDVLGWALDAGINVPLPVYDNPLLILDYAYGSGDDDSSDGTDHAFRQTGLDSNSSRLGISSGTIYQYGFALRPDLSNIHIFTIGLGIPVFNASDLTGLYHYYRLADEATGLASNGINADVNGDDHYLGQGADLALNVNVGQELNMPAGVLKGVTFKTMVGVFKAGDAFGPEGDDEMATRGLMELQFRF